MGIPEESYYLSFLEVTVSQVGNPVFSTNSGPGAQSQLHPGLALPVAQTETASAHQCLPGACQNVQVEAAAGPQCYLH